MTEEIIVYVKDMETYLEPEEYQAFLKAKQEVDEYNKRMDEHEINKAVSERVRDECRKQRHEAENDFIRTLWDAQAMVSSMEAFKPEPYKPTYYFVEHDRFIELVRKKKLEQLEEKERRKAEEEAERQREEERRQREQRIMVATMRQKMLADSEWQEFQKTLNSAIRDLKQQLGNPKPPKFALGCSAEVLNYHPELWCDLKLPSDDEVEGWAQPQILEKIPELLQPFVTFALTPETLVIPKVEYELTGIPCLVWHLDVYIAAKVDLWLPESTISREFHDSKYVALLKAEKLGSFFLKAQLWRSQEGLKTPIALLALLAEGKLEAPGIEVETTYPGASIYTVAGFEERRLEHYYITVQEEFRRFIEDICKNGPLGQGLVVRGLTDEVTANLVELKWNEPLPVSGKPSDAGASDLESVVAKLVELGWTEAEAKKAVETITLPKNATTEEIVSIILGKSYSDS